MVFLAARDDLVSNGFNLWKQRSDLSYQDAGAFDNFAQRGHVVAEFPAGTLLIDDYLGIEIQFDSLDNELDEITLQKRAYRPLALLNLRVAGDGWNPTPAKRCLTTIRFSAPWRKFAPWAGCRPLTARSTSDDRLCFCSTPTSSAKSSSAPLRPRFWPASTANLPPASTSVP